MGRVGNLPVHFGSAVTFWIGFIQTRSTADVKESNMVQNKHTPPQKKMLRLIGMMKYLMRDHRSVAELMDEFGMSRKGVYRYLNLLTELDLDLDQDFKGRYFITDNYCPVCEREHKPLVRRTIKPGTFKKETNEQDCYSLSARLLN